MTRARILIVVAVLAFCGSATAATSGSQPIRWTLKDVKTAIRAIGYPKPHPKKLTCTGQGDGTAGRYTSFSCVATYLHHRRTRFVIAGVGEGGWLCAGKTLAGCKLLRHGFVTTAQVAVFPSLTSAADLSARGYLVDHDQFPYQVVHFCQQAGTSSFACPFTVNGNPVSVSLSFRTAKGGYVISGVTS